MAQSIVIASGVEIRDVGQGISVRNFLNKEATSKGSSKWEYPKGSKKPKFVISVIYTMAEFKAALDEPGAWVVYEGHSRWGQGPAFGPSGTPHCPPLPANPVNPWGVHFRMGYEATDTECVDDLLEHAVSPTEYNLLKAKKKSFLPIALVRASRRAKKVQKKQGKKVKAKQLCKIKSAWRELNACDATLAKTKTCRNVAVLDKRHFYARKPRSGQDEYLTSVVVGSTDLDKVKLKCNFLFMASCSSHEHFYKPMKRRRKKAKSKCIFFLTAKVCAVSHGRNFLREALKTGHSPLTKKGSKAILVTLNGEKKSGLVGRY